MKDVDINVTAAVFSSSLVGVRSMTHCMMNGDCYFTEVNIQQAPGYLEFQVRLLPATGNTLLYKK